jgi:uncharacterized membrane protein HdeD (DUF308 family)
MAATMTVSQRRGMDAISDLADRAAWVYLAAGILSVLFGAVVLSLVLDWVGLFTVALFVGIFLIAWGVLHVLGALLDRPPHWVWHTIGGVLGVGAGVLAIAWPDITLFILAKIIGWSLIVWGVLELLSAFATYGLRHWWLYLVRGLASIALGFLALDRQNATLYFVVTLLGAFVIIWGVTDIVIAFMLHGAKARWQRQEKALARPSGPARKVTTNSPSRTTRKAPARKASSTRKPARRTTKRR